MIERIAEPPLVPMRTYRACTRSFSTPNATSVFESTIACSGVVKPLDSRTSTELRSPSPRRIRDANELAGGPAVETFDAVIAAGPDRVGAACRMKALVRSVPGRTVGCLRPVGRSGAYCRRNGLVAACAARSVGRFSPVSSPLK
jgi:hypothetical protein